MLLHLYGEGDLLISLERKAIVLEEVVIADDENERQLIGSSRVKMVDLKRSPGFMGEVDVIKHLQSQPGVTTVGEIATGFNVRGGKCGPEPRAL